jgi:hypothetical protein
MKSVASYGSRLVLALAAGAALSGVASARDYKIGCASGACAIVDDTGRISFFTIADRKLAEGVDQLRIPATDRIRPPLNISCSSTSGGDACVVTDADGHVWLGPTRRGTAFGEPVARITVPGLR